MEDDYNGEIHIDLSNDGSITYKCTELRMEQGAKVEIYVNDACHDGQSINDHMSNYAGEMTKGLMEFYLKHYYDEQ